MSYDANWLVSVIGLGIAMAALGMLGRARAVWQRDTAELRNSLQRVESLCGNEVTRLRQSMLTLESGMTQAQESSREGRLNRSVRSQALQMLRGGAQAETVAANLGLAVSEAQLLTSVGQILSRPETAVRS